MMVEEELVILKGYILVIVGDIFLIIGESLKNLIDFYVNYKNVVIILIVDVVNLFGYGCIICNLDDEVIKIVE